MLALLKIACMLTISTYIFGLPRESFSQATMPEELIDKQKSKKDPPHLKLGTSQSTPSPQNNITEKFIGTYICELQSRDDDGYAMLIRIVIKLSKDTSTLNLLNYKETIIRTYVDQKKLFYCSKSRSNTVTFDGIAQPNGDIITLKQLTSSNTSCLSPSTVSWKLQNNDLTNFDLTTGKSIGDIVFKRQ